MDKNLLQKQAAALRYAQNQDAAPKVLASGKGHMAEKIIQKAKEYNVAIFQNEVLASSLLDLEVNEEIPPQLYKAVAEVFVWLMNCEEYAQASKD